MFIATGQDVANVSESHAGVVYSQLRPFVPAPPVLAGLLAGLVEHAALWPVASLLDRVHPARRELPQLLRGNKGSKTLSTKDRAALTQLEGVTDAVEAYEAFDRRQPGWLKVELEPAA